MIYSCLISTHSAMQFHISYVYANILNQSPRIWLRVGTLVLGMHLLLHLTKSKLLHLSRVQAV